jgi:hypothetical protein
MRKDWLGGSSLVGELRHLNGGAGESVASSAPPPDFALFLSSHSVFEKMKLVYLKALLINCTLKATRGLNQVAS